MIIDIVFSIVVSLFAFRGWRRGLLLTLLSMLELVVGYLTFYFFHKPMGALLAKLFSLQPLVAYPLGGVAAFGCGLVVVALLNGAIHRRRRQQRGGAAPPLLSGRLLGALLGAAYGLTLSLLVIWGLLMLQTVLPGKTPDVRSSAVGRLAAPWLSKAAGEATRRISGNDSLSATAVRLTEDPAAAARDLKTVLANRHLQSLVSNPRRLKQLASGDLEAMAKHPTLAGLARDRKFVGAARRLGLLEGQTSELTPTEIRRQLARRMAPLSRAVTSLAEDKEVQKLLADKQLTRLLLQRDLAALANDPKFNRLAEKVLQKLKQAGQGLPAEAPE